MAASDYVPIFFKNRLHLVGRPQMSTRPSLAQSAQIKRAGIVPFAVEKTKGAAKSAS
jgi:hypothetical protein